jgi:hypothetical protein
MKTYKNLSFIAAESLEMPRIMGPTDWPCQTAAALHHCQLQEPLSSRADCNALTALHTQIPCCTMQSKHFPKYLDHNLRCNLQALHCNTALCCPVALRQIIVVVPVCGSHSAWHVQHYNKTFPADIITIKQFLHIRKAKAVPVLN